MAKSTITTHSIEPHAWSVHDGDELLGTIYKGARRGQWRAVAPDDRQMPGGAATSKARAIQHLRIARAAYMNSKPGRLYRKA